jgi:hypothetical protein
MFHPCGFPPLRWLAPSTGSRCVATRARQGSPRFVGPTPTADQANLADGRRQLHAPRRNSYPSKVFPRRQPATRHRAPLPSCRLRHLSPCSTPEASSNPTEAGSQTPKQRSRSTSRTLTTPSMSVSRDPTKPTPKHGLHRKVSCRVRKAPRHPLRRGLLRIHEQQVAPRRSLSALPRQGGGCRSNEAHAARRRCFPISARSDPQTSSSLHRSAARIRVAGWEQRPATRAAVLPSPDPIAGEATPGSGRGQSQAPAPDIIFPTLRAGDHLLRKQPAPRPDRPNTEARAAAKIARPHTRSNHQGYCRGGHPSDSTSSRTTPKRHSTTPAQRGAATAEAEGIRSLDRVRLSSHHLISGSGLAYTMAMAAAGRPPHPRRPESQPGTGNALLAVQALGLPKQHQRATRRTPRPPAEAGS